MDIEFGLSKAVLNEVIDALKDILSDTYALYLKTQNFHWNVTGQQFFSLHLLFEKQYEALADAVDELAERIRILGANVDGSFSEFRKRMTIQESPCKGSAQKMLGELVDDHEIIIRKGRPLIARFQELHDDVSSDLMIKRLTFHEKTSWMLRSHLEK